MKSYGQVKGRAHRNYQPEPVRACGRCGRRRPIGEFMDGGSVSRWCSECRSDIDRMLRSDGEGRIQCTTCHRWKPRADFAATTGKVFRMCKECRQRKADTRRKEAE